MVEETNELSQTRYFRYDENGNRRFRVGRDSRVCVYIYNTVNLTTYERWYNNLSDAQSDSSRQNAITFTYDLVHRMTAATDSGSTFAYAYTLDMADRAESIVTGIAGLTPTVTFDQAFDDASRRSQLAAALDATDDFVNDYLYDAAGRMERITQQGNGGNTVAPKRFDFAYDAVSRFDTITRYNNTAGTQTVAVSSYTFDNANRLTDLTHAKGVTTFADYDWVHDDGGRITDQDFTSLVGTNGNADYSYDDTNQLTASDYAADWQTDESYTYDENGNRTNNNYTVGANNRLTSDGTYYYTYDANGNRIARFIDVDTSGTLNANDTDITTYAWDHRNRLLTVTTYAVYGGSSTKVTAQVYDHVNRWIKRVIDPDGASGADDILQRVFIYDGNQIVLQFDKTGAGSLVSADRSHRYVWGPLVDQILADGDLSGGMGAGSQSALGKKKANARPSRPSRPSGLGRRSAGSRPRGGLGSKKASASPPVVRWPLCDHLQSVRDIANYESGTDTTTVINHRVYNAFGKLTSETSPSIPHLFHYTARALDTSTGQQNNLHRWYDPAVGRWDSEDPIEYDAGDMNLSRYVGNGPTDATDPFGLKIWTSSWDTIHSVCLGTWYTAHYTLTFDDVACTISLSGPRLTGMWYAFPNTAVNTGSLVSMNPKDPIDCCLPDGTDGTQEVKEYVFKDTADIVHGVGKYGLTTANGWKKTTVIIHCECKAVKTSKK